MVRANGKSAYGVILLYLQQQMKENTCTYLYTHNTNTAKQPPDPCVPCYPPLTKHCPHIAVKIREDPGTEPDHTIGMKLFASQSRLDYMGTSVLMGRVSSFGVTLRDEWKLKQCAESDDDTTRRCVVNAGKWRKCVYGEKMVFIIRKGTKVRIVPPKGRQWILEYYREIGAERNLMMCVLVRKEKIASWKIYVMKKKSTYIWGRWLKKKMCIHLKKEKVNIN